MYIYIYTAYISFQALLTELSEKKQIQEISNRGYHCVTPFIARVGLFGTSNASDRQVGTWDGESEEAFLDDYWRGISVKDAVD